MVKATRSNAAKTTSGSAALKAGAKADITKADVTKPDANDAAATGTKRGRAAGVKSATAGGAAVKAPARRTPAKAAARPRAAAAERGRAASKRTVAPRRATAKMSVSKTSVSKTSAFKTPASKSPAKTSASKSPAPKGAAVKTTAAGTRAARSPATASAAHEKPMSGAAAQCAPVQLGYLSGFVGFHLRLAQDASYRAFARIKDKELVKPGRYPALAIIHLNPGISQSALGRAIARDKSTVSPLIKDLQNNGFISRKPSPSDRRSVTLVLTRKGERVLERLHARALEHEGDLDKILGTAKGRLVAVLDKITGGLAV